MCDIHNIILGSHQARILGKFAILKRMKRIECFIVIVLLYEGTPINYVDMDDMISEISDAGWIVI